MESINVLCITQARVNSTRLPRKVLLPLGNSTILGIHLARLKAAKKVDKLVVATTFEEGSEEILKVSESLGVSGHQGSLDNVLDRFYQIAKLYQPRYVVRVTSDCPLIDPTLVDEVIDQVVKGDFDYYANIITEDYPDGQDVEVFTFDTLQKAWQEATAKSDLEHVTPFIRNNCDVKGGSLFRGGDHVAPVNYNHVRMTIDEPSDLEMMSWLINEKGINLTWQEYVQFMMEHPEALVNARIIRNEGYLKSLNKDKSNG